MATILDGKATADTIRAEVAAEVARLVATGARRPGLAAVLVGDDPASHVYVGSKTRACEEAGLLGRSVILPEATPADDLRRVIDGLNADPEIDGILIQLPLPKHLQPIERELLDRVAPEKDVDGFHPQSVGKLWLDQPSFAPATPSGVIQLLRRYNIPMAGRHAVVVGRSAIVGKPMAALLLRENATVTICHSRTTNLPAVCRQGEIVIAAVGRPAFLGADAIQDGAVVVDVGINAVSDAAEVERLFPGDAGRQDTLARRGKVLVGDVHYTELLPKVSAITPVPGGVGPLTVAMLLVNTLEAARRRQGLTP